jgi:hypothetical protein
MRMTLCPQCQSEKDGNPLKGLCSCPTKSEHGYTTPYVPMALNKEFWKEVLVGRTIKKVVWDEKGIDALVLDDGQSIFIDHKGTGRIYIKD